MTTQELNNILQLNPQDYNKLDYTLSICNQFNSNSINNTLSKLNHYNFSLDFDNFINFLLDDLKESIIEQIYKDTNILISSQDMEIVTDDNTILLAYTQDNETVLNYLDQFKFIEL